MTGSVSWVRDLMNNRLREYWVVSVAQRAEHSAVAREVGGSSPLAHPMRARSSARIERQIPDLKVAGSNPAGRMIFARFGNLSLVRRAASSTGRATDS